jgi:hypothetical protein
VFTTVKYFVYFTCSPNYPNKTNNLLILFFSLYFTISFPSKFIAIDGGICFEVDTLTLKEGIVNEAPRMKLVICQ